MRLALPALPFASLHPSLLTLPLAALAAVVVMVINEASATQSLVALHRLARRDEAIDRLDTAMRRALDAETAQRGYLLTARPSYLAPAEHASADLAENMAALKAYYADDAVATAQLGDWEAHAQAGLAALGQKAVADPPPTAALTQLTDDLVTREQARARGEMRTVLDTLRTSRLGIGATAAVAFLALLLVLRQTVALEGVQRRHTQALRDERARLELEAQTRTADLSELARHLNTVRDDESGQLATVLHEDLGALLTTAKLDLARLRRQLADERPEVLARLAHLGAAFDNGIALKRRIIEDLRPSMLSNLGLVSALDAVLREFSDSAHLPVTSDLRPLPLSDNAQLAIYRLVQESLTNIAKYAQARTVSVAMGPQPDGLAQVVVSDDGAGFDPQATRHGAHGLMGMRYRVESVGGRLSVTSAPGRGTRIVATVPMVEEAAAVSA